MAARVASLRMKVPNTGASDMEVLQKHDIPFFNYNQLVLFYSLPWAYKSENFRSLLAAPLSAVVNSSCIY
jgi:hypothetical protein